MSKVAPYDTFPLLGRDPEPCAGQFFFFFFFEGLIFKISRKLYLKNFNIKNKDNKISQGREKKKSVKSYSNLFLTMRLLMI